MPSDRAAAHEGTSDSAAPQEETRKPAAEVSQVFLLRHAERVDETAERQELSLERRLLPRPRELLARVLPTLPGR